MQEADAQGEGDDAHQWAVEEQQKGQKSGTQQAETSSSQVEQLPRNLVAPPSGTSTKATASIQSPRNSLLPPYLHHSSAPTQWVGSSAADAHAVGGNTSPGAVVGLDDSAAATLLNVDHAAATGTGVADTSNASQQGSSDYVDKDIRCNDSDCLHDPIIRTKSYEELPEFHDQPADAPAGGSGPAAPPLWLQPQTLGPPPALF